MPDTKKILGWGKCTIDGKNDIIEGSASLSVEEGEEQEALIEGGSAEGRKKAPDKYVLTYRRRLGSAGDATPGFTEDAGDVTVTPENAGAVGVSLTACTRHIAIGFDSTDGTTATYTWKTKGVTDANGALTDITLSGTGNAGG